MGNTATFLLFTLKPLLYYLIQIYLFIQIFVYYYEMLLFLLLILHHHHHVQPDFTHSWV